LIIFINLVANSDKHEKFVYAILHMAVLLGFHPLGARSSYKTAPKSNYDYHDAFAPFFYTKMEQQHGPQAVNRVQNIGKIEQITFLQLN
jgi:hypothetical protein